MKVDHAINTGERRAAALVPVGVELLLGEDITAILTAHLVSNHSKTHHGIETRASSITGLTSHEKDTMLPASLESIQSGAQRNMGRLEDH